MIIFLMKFTIVLYFPGDIHVDSKLTSTYYIAVGSCSFLFSKSQQNNPVKQIDRLDCHGNSSYNLNPFRSFDALASLECHVPTA